MRGKQGKPLVNNLMSLIISVAMIFVLIVMFYIMFSHNFNRNEEAAKNYLEQLEESIQEARGGATVTMSILPIKKEGIILHIVYFNGEPYFPYNHEGENHLYHNLGNSSNDLAVCYSKEEEDSKCLTLEMKKPSVLERGEAKWLIGEGEKFTITLEEEKYVFRKE